ncbi:NITA, partial [Symbiodinium sp. KB8]
FMEVVAEDVTLWKAASASPLSTLRREGLTPPSTPPHSWWQTSRPPSAASVEWFDGEAARPPSRNVVRYPAQRVYGSEGGLCGSLLGGPRDPCASTVVGATKERNLWAEPKRAAKAMLGTKRFLDGTMDPASRDGYRLVPNTDAPVERPTNGPGNPGERAARSQQPTGQSSSRPRLDFALEDPGKQWIAEKALRVMRHDSAGFATVDATSVYGAALALPQLARSAGWTISYTGLALRGLLFMIMNNLLQGFLLYMISKEERIINKFGSQMFLCDFAAHHQNCPHGSNCVGPGGTEITPSRLYDFDLWSTRTFVRDSFKLLFPEKEHEIMEKIDPGEYGVESYYLRTVCCFLFVLGLWHDLAGSWDMLDLLWCVPADSERWIVPTAGQKPQEEEIGVSQAYTDAALYEMIELDFVQFRVAGMPLHWKLFNLFCLLCPKIYLWLLTVDIGIVFLMETSEIEDMIINCVALGFILQIDELMMGIMPPECTKMLEVLKGYAKENRPQTHLPEEEECRRHQLARNWHCWTPALWAALIPRRLLGMLAVTSFFVFKYYVEHCVHLDDGSWVSKPLRLPKESSLSILSFVFGPLPMLFPIDAEDQPIWEMPDLQNG